MCVVTGITFIQSIVKVSRMVKKLNWDTDPYV